MFCQCYCWTLYPERGRKLYSFNRLNKPGRHNELLDSLPREGTETYSSLAFASLLLAFDCWTLYPERGRKPAHQSRTCPIGCYADCWTLRPERGRKHVGGVPIGKVAELLDSSPPPRGDGNRLAIGHKGVGRERVVGLFTSKRSRISTAAPSRNFYSTSDSCRTTVRRRPRGPCRGAPRIRGDDPK